MQSGTVPIEEQCKYYSAVHQADKAGVLNECLVQSVDGMAQIETLAVDWHVVADAVTAGEMNTQPAQLVDSPSGTAQSEDEDETVDQAVQQQAAQSEDGANQIVNAMEQEPVPFANLLQIVAPSVEGAGFLPQTGFAKPD